MSYHEGDTASVSSSQTHEDPQAFYARSRSDGRRNPSISSDHDHGSNRKDIFMFSGMQRMDKEVDTAHENDEKYSSGNAPRNSAYHMAIDLWDLIRPDFILGHLDYDSFKVVSRTWANMFLMALLMIIRRTEEYQGITAFLSVIAAVIEAAGGISYTEAFFTCLIDLSFVLFAFATSAIANAISWRIRGYPTVQQLMADLVTEGVCRPGEKACFMHEAHRGRYLTTKTTVIALFGIMFALFFTGYASQKSRLFIIPSLLSAICAFISGLYLNFTPQFDPWLYGRAIVLPFGLAFSGRFVLSVIWFPVTSNYKFFGIVRQAITSARDILREDVATLHKLKPSDPSFIDVRTGSARKMDMALAKFALLEFEGLIARGEVAFSRLDPGDLGEFRSVTRSLVNSLISAGFFYDQIIEKRNTIADHSFGASSHQEPSLSQSRRGTDVSQASSRPDLTLRNARKFGQQLIPHPNVRLERRNTLSRVEPLKKKKWLGSQLNHVYAPAGHFEDERLDAEIEYTWDEMRIEDLDELYVLILKHYAPVSDAILTLLSAIVEWSTATHKFRLLEMIYPSWRQSHQKQQRINAEAVVQALGALNAAIKEKDTSFAGWAKLYKETFSNRNRAHLGNVLSIDAYYGCTIRGAIRNVKRLAQYCMFIDKEQARPKFVYPFMRLRSQSPRFETEYVMSGLTNTDADHVYMPHEHESNVQRRNPDSTPPRRFTHLIGLQIQKIVSILQNPQVLFSIKRAVVSTVAGLTYTSRTTILFSYENRVVWVPIMVALSISYQALDGVYGLVAKLFYTFIGCLVGMVVWYISTGRGRGNPYGLGAALGVVMVILAFFRHFNKHKVPMGAIILSVTTVLVTGTSWIDGQNLPQDVVLGWGWSVAWKRFICVIIGLAIAFIGTVLPRPVTAKKKIRVMLSSSLEALGECETQILNFAIERTHDPMVHIVPRQDLIMKELRKIGILLGSVHQLSMRLDFEPPLAGIWPKHRYMLLTKLAREVAHMLTSVYHLLDQIDDAARIPFIIQRMGLSNVELMSSTFSVLILGSRALSSAQPLPSVTPGHLTEIYSHLLQGMLDFDVEKEDNEVLELIESRYCDRDGRVMLALITNMYMIFKHLDGALRIIKGLVGEIYGLDLDVFNFDLEAGLGPTHSSHTLNK